MQTSILKSEKNWSPVDSKEVLDEIGMAIQDRVILFDLNLIDEKVNIPVFTGSVLFGENIFLRQLVCSRYIQSLLDIIASVEGQINLIKHYQCERR